MSGLLGLFLLQVLVTTLLYTLSFFCCLPVSISSSATHVLSKFSVAHCTRQQVSAKKSIRKYPAVFPLPSLHMLLFWALWLSELPPMPWSFSGELEGDQDSILSQLWRAFEEPQSSSATHLIPALMEILCLHGSLFNFVHPGTAFQWKFLRLWKVSWCGNDNP